MSGYRPQCTRSSRGECAEILPSTQVPGGYQRQSCGQEWICTHQRACAARDPAPRPFWSAFVARIGPACHPHACERLVSFPCVIAFTLAVPCRAGPTFPVDLGRFAGEGSSYCPPEPVGRPEPFELGSPGVRER